MPSPRSSGRALFAAIVAIVASFLASTLVAQRSNRAIDRAARDIEDNASPTIRLLTEARNDVRQMAVDISEYANAPAAKRPALMADLARARRRMHENVAANEALPLFPGEEAHNEAIRVALRALDARLDRMLADVAERGPVAVAGGVEKLRPELNQLSERVRLDVEFNAAKAHELARYIKQVRQRAMWIAWTLDGLCVLFALAAGSFARRSQLAYTRLLAEHSRLVERRADELEQFAGRVAHDVLSPLAAARLSLDLLHRDPTAQSDRSARLLGRLRSALDRAARIVEGLYEFARAGAGPVDGAHATVRTVVEDVTEGLRAEAQAAEVELSVASTAADGSEVACSPGVLTSLLSNLLHNAVKYIGASTVRRVDLRVVERGPSLRFEVEDTGPGLPPGLGESVFLPYVRGGSRQPGLGLGLATVRKIAQAHGGAVGVRSVPERGCLFWFELPRTPQPS